MSSWRWWFGDVRAGDRGKGFGSGGVVTFDCERVTDGSLGIFFLMGKRRFGLNIFRTWYFLAICWMWNPFWQNGQGCSLVKSVLCQNMIRISRRFAQAAPPQQVMVSPLVLSTNETKLLFLRGMCGGWWRISGEE